MTFVVKTMTAEEKEMVNAFLESNEVTVCAPKKPKPTTNSKPKFTLIFTPM